MSQILTKHWDSPSLTLLSIFPLASILQSSHLYNCRLLVHRAALKCPPPLLVYQINLPSPSVNCPPTPNRVGHSLLSYSRHILPALMYAALLGLTGSPTGPQAPRGQGPRQYRTDTPWMLEKCTYPSKQMTYSKKYMIIHQELLCKCLKIPQRLCSLPQSKIAPANAMVLWWKKLWDNISNSKQWGLRRREAWPEHLPVGPSQTCWPGQPRPPHTGLKNRGGEPDTHATSTSFHLKAASPQGLRNCNRRPRGTYSTKRDQQLVCWSVASKPFWSNSLLEKIILMCSSKRCIFIYK